MSIGYLCSPAAQKVYEGKKGRIDLQGDAAQCRPEYSDAACPESSMSDETLAAHDECSVTDAVFNPRSKKENQRDSSAKPEKLVELTAKSSDIDTDVNSITGGGEYLVCLILGHEANWKLQNRKISIASRLHLSTTLLRNMHSTSTRIRIQCAFLDVGVS